MEHSLRLWQVEIGVRVAVWDHIIGIDLRLDKRNKIYVIVGIPFVSLKLTIWRD